ncbi:MAG TPA: carboxypeptidase-like regulatory domain-containing protein [Pyrinomonadaceae bacterium]|nr:carboxypeptidase-like regulatory domain-containing protein [Pyrinomonadaceae bacterium]
MKIQNKFRVIGAIALLVAGSCFRVPAQQSANVDEKAEVKTGKITGRVVTDSGQPMTNATIYVRPFSNSAPGPGRTTNTDAEGNFQVDGLEPALYTIFVSAPAYVSGPRGGEPGQPTLYRLGESPKFVMYKGGVLTGTVTNTAGEPVVAIGVRALLVREADGQPANSAGAQFWDRNTDDRGIFRIYGMQAGTYVVSAGGFSGNFPFNLNAYDVNVPTYSPSSTRDTATEFTVRAGEETSGVDIRYRAEPGHIISGSVIRTNNEVPVNINITLTSVLNDKPQWSTSSFQLPSLKGFAFNGISDGDYDISATTSVGGEFTTSEVRRITVKGANVTGIELKTMPLATVSGRLNLESSKTPECKDKRRPQISEMLVRTEREGKVNASNYSLLRYLGAQAVPAADGSFLFKTLLSGQYTFSIKYFAKYWFVDSITLATHTAAGVKIAPEPVDVSRTWVRVKSGDRLTGLIVNLSEGAASLRGQLAVPKGQASAENFLLYLTPAERERANNAFHVYVTTANADGSFTFSNLAPGRYWPIVRARNEVDALTHTKIYWPDQVDTRARLRREAEAAKKEIELKPCENKTGFDLTFPPANP